MSKTLTLTIGERVAALKLFDAFKGSITALATLLDDVKQFTVTEEEWTEANLVKTPQPNGDIQWKWDEEKVMKEVTLQDPTADYLKGELKRRSEANEITLADIALVSLDKKINA